MKTLRLPAEWENVDAVLIAWPHEKTDWAYMLDDVRQTYGNIICALSQRVKVIIVGPEAPQPQFLPQNTRMENVIVAKFDTNDTWTRDYGPITVITDQGPAHIDYQFNGWGLKFAADLDNGINAKLIDAGILPYQRINRLGFTLEGGSIESDGQGFILTTARCLLSPNRNGDLSLEQIEEQLKADLGATTIGWLANGELEGDDTDSHIDTLARLAPPGDTIFFVGCNDPADSHFEGLQLMKEELQQLRRANGMPFNLIELPLPDPIYDPDDGTRLPATYANFLIVNDAVLLPTYNQPLKDMTARMAIQAAMPEYEVIPIDCRSLIRQHGSLHCATMQIPKL